MLEGFLARLAEGDDRDTLVLKGGVLLAAYATRRATRDVDFLARDLDNDRDVVLQLCSQIVRAKRNDGLDFDVGSARAELIRDDDECSGVRVSMRCKLAQAQISFHIDVNVGDPVWPAPGMVEVPALLGGSIRLLGYPITAVHAEKIVTAIQRGHREHPMAGFRRHPSAERSAGRRRGQPDQGAPRGRHTPWCTVDRLAGNASRCEIADLVEDAFDPAGTDRAALLAVAASKGAHPVVLDRIRELPDCRFRSMRELWDYHADVPVD